MNKNSLTYLKSRESRRIKKLMELKQNMSYKEYFKKQSIFSDDYLFFSSYEFFMDKECQRKTGSIFIQEWIIYFMIDKTIQRWLYNHSSLESISILIPYCGSGAFTQLVIEYLLVHFQLLFPSESKANLIKKITEQHIQSWDVNDYALNICNNRIYNLFGIHPILKHTSTLLETDHFDIILGSLPRGNILSDDFKQSISSEYDDISLDFIQWSLRSLNKNGEICLIVPENLSNLPIYHLWRENLYHNLHLHRFVQLPESSTNYQPSLILGLNLHNNHLIESGSLIDFSESLISTEDFYNKNYYYSMKK